MTTIDNLVRMANQIATNLAYEGDPTAATAEHIQLFWEPLMKKLIFDHGDDGLNPGAAAAMAALKTAS